PFPTRRSSDLVDLHLQRHPLDLAVSGELDVGERDIAVPADAVPAVDGFALDGREPLVAMTHELVGHPVAGALQVGDDSATLRCGTGLDDPVRKGGGEWTPDVLPPPQLFGCRCLDLGKCRAQA